MKLELLNSESLSEITGGNVSECTQAGDTLYKNIKVHIKLCATYEASCTGKFTYQCGVNDMSCTQSFSLKPV